MISGVLESREPMHLEVMTHSESVHLYAELKNSILTVPTDTGGLRDSYRINVHHCYIMLIIVDIIMLMLIAISSFLLQLIICL
jgi:hypothetical protein